MIALQYSTCLFCRTEEVGMLAWQDGALEVYVSPLTHPCNDCQRCDIYSGILSRDVIVLATCASYRMPTNKPLTYDASPGSAACIMI